MMYIYLKVDKTQPFTDERKQKKKLIHVFEQFEQLNNLIKTFLQSALTVREQSWRRDLRVYECSVLFGSRWWRASWLLYETVLNSASSKSSTSYDAVGSVSWLLIQAQHCSSTPRRTNASIRSLSAEVAKPHQWNVKETTAFPRTTAGA